MVDKTRIAFNTLDYVYLPIVQDKNNHGRNMTDQMHWALDAYLQLLEDEGEGRIRELVLKRRKKYGIIPPEE